MGGIGEERSGGGGEGERRRGKEEKEGVGRDMHSGYFHFRGRS